SVSDKACVSRYGNLPDGITRQRPPIHGQDRKHLSRCVWVYFLAGRAVSSQTLPVDGYVTPVPVFTERAGRSRCDPPATSSAACVPLRQLHVSVPDDLFEDRYEVPVVSIHDVAQFIAQPLLDLIPERQLRPRVGDVDLHVGNLRP